MSDALRQTVVGAVIVENGCALAARRTRPESVAGQWEFPGGKVEPGEDPRAALVREIREELSATIEIHSEVLDEQSPWKISDRYALRLFVASVLSGEIRPGFDHDLVQWVQVAGLDQVDWLPSDRMALAAVRRALAER